MLSLLEGAGVRVGLSTCRGWPVAGTMLLALVYVGQGKVFVSLAYAWRGQVALAQGSSNLVYSLCWS